MRYLRNIKGFTLVEVLVAMAVFSVLGMMTTVAMVGTLQGAKKAAAVALVKNEGARVINTVTQMLKFSTGVTACGGNSVTFQSRADGSNPAVFSCVDDGGGKFHIASNSASLMSDKVEMMSCNISCDAQIKQVNVSFTVQMKATTFVSEKATTQFQTQIGLRNQEQ